MAWDDQKDPEDLIRSNEWDNMVTDQKGHVSRHEPGGSDALNFSLVDVTNLDGSAGTSGQFLQTDGTSLSFADVSSFSGNYNDLTNVPELPEGVSLNEYRSWQNQIVSAIAENQFEVGLSLMGYPNGFYDVFVNQDNIESSSNLNIIEGMDGNIRLAENLGTSVDTGIEKSYNTGDTGEHGVVVNPNTDLLGVKVGVDGEYSQNISRVRIEDSNGNILDEKTGISSGDTVLLQAPLTSGNSYPIIADNQGNEYESSNGGVTHPQTSTDIDITSGWLFGSENDGFNYNIETVQAWNGYEQTGSFTSAVQNLGYSATELTLTADYTLNGQSISPELQDGNGNTIYSLSESEIGQTISISTSATDYQVVWNFSGDGSDTPILNKYEVGLDDGS